MSTLLLDALNKLEGKPTNRTVNLNNFLNRSEMLEHFENIIASAIEIAVTKPQKKYELFFELDKAILRIPGTSYSKCIACYTLTSDDIITLLLSEIASKYIDHEKVMSVDSTNSCICIKT